MQIEIIDNSKLNQLPGEHGCEINCVYVKITDLKSIIDEFEINLTETGWISGLDEISKITFRTTVTKTIDKIVNEIISKNTSEVNEDIGEYIVSHAAREALKVMCSHRPLPLAELLKEIIIGNPGFDFHTISQKSYLIFGEAKFSLKSTPRSKAMKQIVEFMGDRDNSELLWLKPFLDKATEKNIVKNKKGYSAAFSYNNKNIITTLNNALKSKPMNKLLNYEEFYLIAVEIC